MVEDKRFLEVMGKHGGYEFMTEYFPRAEKKVTGKEGGHPKHITDISRKGVLYAYMTTDNGT